MARAEELARRLVWLANHIVPKRRRQVLLAVFPDYECSGRAIARALPPDEGWRVVWLVGEDRPPPDQNAGISVMRCRRRSVRSVWHFLRSRYVFSTHIPFGALPSPRGQVSVNVWHGMPIKSIAMLEPGGRPVRADITLSMSEHHRPILAAAFGVPRESLRVVGQPRHDLMHASDRSIWSACGLELERFRHVALWMPTFRGHPSHREGGAETGVLLPPDATRSLSDLLLELNAVLIIKRHPYEQGLPRLEAQNVVDLGSQATGDRWVGTYELLGGADVLVSDLSSAWIDYLVLDRPIVTYFPDLDEYVRDRPLVLEPYEEWAPSRVARTWEEFLAELAAALAGRDPHRDRRRRLRGVLAQNCEPGAAARVLELLGIRPAERGQESAR